MLLPPHPGRILAATVLVMSCSRDSSRSPTCGIALIAGPSLIQQQLSNPRAVIPDPPRGLPEALPAMVVQQQRAEVTVGYDVDGRIVMGYRGPGFPTQGGYGLLVVDDTSQRAMGVLILESEEPTEHPRLGTVVGGAASIHLYGVRVDWAGVSNPRCPLFGPAPGPPRRRPRPRPSFPSAGRSGRSSPPSPGSRDGIVRIARPDRRDVTPAVAVTAPRRQVDGRERVALNASYVHALAGAGLVPLVVPAILEPDRAVAALAAARGLVLTGGEDVDPGRYGATAHPRLGTVDPVRDAAELALIEAARARRLPILAICRGIQILNVALGGTLYQDLGSERPGALRHDAEQDHDLRVAPDSALAAALGAGAARVNSRHHQAIRELAPGLRAVAWAEDGLIEGAEASDGAREWLVGVQWHPEDMTERALFQSFARAVG